MTDYSTLTDDELNRAVAERLGWRLADTNVPNLYAAIINPQGEQTGMLKLASDGVRHALVDGQRWPQYATSIDAAAALDFDDWKLIIRVDGEKLEITVLSGSTRLLPIIIEAHRKDFARTLAAAWLRYKDATVSLESVDKE